MLMLKISKLVWPLKIRDCILILNPNACNQNYLPTCYTRPWNPGLQKMQIQIELNPTGVLDSVQKNKTHHPMPLFLNQYSAKLFRKGLGSKYFRLVGICSRKSAIGNMLTDGRGWVLINHHLQGGGE